MSRSFRRTAARCEPGPRPPGRRGRRAPAPTVRRAGRRGRRRPAHAGGSRRLRRAGVPRCATISSSSCSRARARARRSSGYGAPGKGNTLLNHCGIRSRPARVHRGPQPAQARMYLPGTHIPIHPAGPHRRGHGRTTCWCSRGTSRRRSRRSCRMSATGVAGWCSRCPSSRSFDPIWSHEGGPVLRGLGHADA